MNDEPDLSPELKSLAAELDALTATDEDRAAPDKRLAKLHRAKETVESLRARFPENGEMTNAIRRLTQAIEFSSRRGGTRPPHAQRRAPSEDFRR